MLQSVGVGGEEFQPALHASIVIADLGDVFERFVVGVDEEFGRPEVSVEAFDGPDDATSFQVDRNPGSFVVEGGAADEHDGADGAVRLFLLEGGAKDVQAGVGVQAERAGVVGDSVSVRVDENGRGGEFLEELPDDDFQFRSENEFNTLLQQSVNEAEPGGEILQEFAVVPKSSEE